MSTITSTPPTTDSTSSSSSSSSVAPSSSLSRLGFAPGGNPKIDMDGTGPQLGPMSGGTHDSSHLKPVHPAVPITIMAVMLLGALLLLGGCWRSHRRAKVLVKSIPSPEVIVMTNLEEVEQRREERAATAAVAPGAAANAQAPNDSIV